jgi:NifU-like protein involved in Fe-S cluster formation
VYSSKLLDHFEHPRHTGELPDASAQVRIENPACGDILVIAVKVENGVISEVRFRAKGCVPAMACGSAIATLIHGRAIGDVLKVRKEDVLSEVESVPPASGHAIHLALDAASQLWKELSKVGVSATSC